MANVLAELFQNTANAIREKTGEQGKMKPAEFPEKIRAIEAGTAEPDLEEITIRENGVYEPAESDGYSKVTVEVPTETIVKEAELIPLTVTKNGKYYPVEPVAFGNTYSFRNDYTQADLQELFQCSLMPSEDTSILINGLNDGVAVYLENGFYALQFYGDGIWHIFLSAEGAEYMGVSNAGWYRLITATFELIPLESIPTINLTADEYTLAVEDITMLNPLFELKEMDGFSEVEVNVPQEITGDGTAVEEMALVPLTVTSNGVYYPPKEALTTGKTYTFRNDYTQEELQALYEKSNAIIDDGLFAWLIECGDTMIGIMHDFGMYTVYMSDGHIWIPADIAQQMGYTAGWNSGTDMTDMTPTEIPTVTFDEECTPYIAEWQRFLSTLFEVKQGAFSRVDVNVRGERNTVIKEGEYTPTTADEIIVIKHNLGFVPDIINIRVIGYIPDQTPMFTVFCGTFLSQDIAKNGYTILTQQFVSLDGKLGLGTGKMDFCETNDMSYVTSVNAETFTVGGCPTMKHFVGGEYKWVAYGNI